MSNSSISKLAKLIFLILFLFNFGNCGLAVEVHGKPNAWFLVLTKIKFNDKWSFVNEFHVRRDNWLKDQQQLIIRPAFNFEISPGFEATAGYSFIRNSPYGKYPILAATPEHNFWEQITLNHSIKKFEISHRYRLEHRFIGKLTLKDNDEYKVDGFNYKARLRYRLTLKTNISELFYIHAFDELWVPISKTFQQVGFDRNWLYAGVGHNLSNSAHVELAYLHQWTRNNEIRYEVHPTIQLTFSHNLSFSKKEEAEK